ncbi:MAG: tetratricopeptide repeat protein [Cyanobacteria bacterium P01_F01_bin.150]
MAESIPVADALMKYGRALDALEQRIQQSSPSPTKSSADSTSQSTTPSSNQHQRAIAPPPPPPYSLSPDVLSLDALPPDALSPDALSSNAKIVLEALAIRDTLSKSLTEAKTISATDWINIESLDKRLKKHDHFIAQSIDLEEWRSLTHPSEFQWWWYFEPPSRLPWLEEHCKWLHKLDALWSFLTLLLLTMSVTLFLNTLSRFAEGGLDSLGTWTIVVQALLTLAGGTAALTKQGRQWVESWLLRWRIPKAFWQEFSLLVSVVVVFLVFCIYQFGLPRVAKILHQEGHRSHYQQDHFDSALQYYQKAIALQPDFAQAHYNLGNLYEELQQPDNAAKEYQIVIQSNLNDLELLTKLRAHNNLGRLYIIEGKHREAWTPLERGLSFTTEDDQDDPAIALETYNLIKNLGWLRLEQTHLLAADERLREAIGKGKAFWQMIKDDADLQDRLNHKTEPAAAYCLEAQVLEGLTQLQGLNQYDAEILEFWGKCSDNGRLLNTDEAKWVAVARERLSGFGPKEEEE